MGPLCLRRDAQVITKFRTWQTGALLAYLAAHPNRSFRREELIEMLWPDIELKSGQNRLRITLTALRKMLDPKKTGPGQPAPVVVVADRTFVRLNPVAFTTDKAKFEACLLKARQACEASVGVDLLQQALACYHSEFLPGYEEPWIEGMRQSLAEQHLNAMRDLVKLLSRTGDIASALDYALRVVKADPVSEEAHLTLIQLYVASGQSGAAQRHCHVVKQSLDSEWEGRPPARAHEFIAQLEKAADQISSGGHNRTATLTSNAMPFPSPPPPSYPVYPPDRGHMPVPNTPFLGREDDLAQVQDMLRTPHTRLLTLTGLGGSGKTRLALALGKALQDDFNGAAWFVSLASVRDSGLILDEVVHAMMPIGRSSLPPGDQVAQALGATPALLILDNFEHLLPEGARAVRTLLEAAPNLLCLVTSRQPLHLTGEYVYAVPPLATPLSAGTPERLLEFASVQLFVDRARAVQPRFTVTRANASAIGALCHYLEGVPLAIELAAAFAQTLTPAQIRLTLKSRFRLLVNRNIDAPPRHASLRNALDWSYDLLAPPLQHFFSRLSILRGRWSLEAAAAIGLEREALSADMCDEDSVLITVELLTQLRERSLLLADEDGDEMRYHLLETVREYAAERLDVTSPHATTDAQHRHVVFFLEMAEEAELYLIGPEAGAWLERLEREHDNMRAALHFILGADASIGMRADHVGLRLAAALWRFWHVRGFYREGQEWLRQALEAHRDAPDVLRCKALLGQGNLAFKLNDLISAEAAFTEYLNLAREAEDTGAIAAALGSLGTVARAQGDLVKAQLLREESLNLFRRIADRRGVALTLANLANVLTAQGDHAAARQLLLESLDLFRALGITSEVVLALNNLAHIALQSGEDAYARAYLLESVDLACAMQNRFCMAQALFNLATLFARQRLGSQAVEFLGCAEALLEQIRVPLMPGERAQVDLDHAQLRAALREHDFAIAWERGRTLSPEQAATLVRGELPSWSKTNIPGV